MNFTSSFLYIYFSLFHAIYPALTGSKTPTSKFSEYEEFRWEITARLVKANNQWWMDKPHTD
ncbi:hypothetical protein CN539_13870 [Bacillus toyonensis]|nr:hypothetical protein CN539_13870 [Bacillus toyonensis]